MSDKRTDIEKVRDCEKILGNLQAERKTYEPMVDEIIKFVSHGRRKIGDNTKQKGKRTGVDVYDGTAISAANLAADGIHGYLCSKSIHWFDFTLPGKINFPRTSIMRAWTGKRLDDLPEVKQWLDDCEEVQYAAYQRSNFYDFSPNYIRDGMTIGTPTAIIDEDIKKGRIVFTLPHFRECYVSENNFGEVDTLYRVYNLTLKQLVQKFGADVIFGLDHQLKTQYKNNPYTEEEVLHATYPRTDFDPTKLDKKNKPWASMWILRPGVGGVHSQVASGSGGSKLIDEAGYSDLPTVTWRWRKNNDEVYARTPAWDAYVDISLANQQGRTNLVAGHKMVEPPMVGPEDLRGKVRNVPGGWTWIQGDVTKDRIPMPLLTGIQLPYGAEQQERTDRAIKQHFNVDFFLMLNQAAFNKVELTATQVVGMQGESAAIMGTRIGRFQNEGLDNIQDRVWNIETRARRMPPPPPILQDMGGVPIEIDYLGPLAQSQKRLFKMQGVRAGVELAGQIGQVFPYAIDKIDGDKMMEEGLESVGFPNSAIRSNEEVKKIRAERQKQEEIQKTLEMAEQASKATKNLSKPMEEGSLMEAVTEGAAE